MAAPKIGLYRATEDLVRRYFTEPDFPARFKEVFEKNPNYKHRGYRLKDCVWLIAQLGELNQRKYSQYASVAFNALSREEHPSIDVITSLFTSFYNDPKGFASFSYQLRNNLTPLGSGIDREIFNADAMPSNEGELSAQKQNALDNLHKKHPLKDASITRPSGAPKIIKVIPTAPSVTPNIGTISHAEPLGRFSRSPGGQESQTGEVEVEASEEAPSGGVITQSSAPSGGAVSSGPVSPVPSSGGSQPAPFHSERLITPGTSGAGGGSSGRAGNFPGAGGAQNRVGNLGRKAGGKVAGQVGKQVAKRLPGLAAKAALGASNPVGWALLAKDLAFSKTFWKIVIAIILFIIAIPLFSMMNEQGAIQPPFAEKISNGGSSGGGSSDINSCTFYRGGVFIPGVKFGNPSLANLINDISSKVGVPPQIISAIMRVETGDRMALTDTSYLDNDYDAHSSGVAYGIMQFTPGTFSDTFNRNSSSLSQLFSKTSVKTLIDPQDRMASSDVFRIYSIKDSITAAAYKVKGDKQSINSDGPWDEQTIKVIAARYYGTNADGTTNYRGYDGSTQNYGEDLWKSWQDCKTRVPSNNAAFCPIQNSYITCGPSKPTPTKYSLCNQGHCAGDYPSAPYCSTDPSVFYAADIAGQADQIVYIPSITTPDKNEVHSVTCNFVGESPNYNGTESINQFDCTDDVNSNRVWVEFHHMKVGSGPAVGSKSHSGDPIGGKINPFLAVPHVHVQIGIDGGCGSDSSGCVAADKYLQCGGGV